MRMFIRDFLICLTFFRHWNCCECIFEVSLFLSILVTCFCFVAVMQVLDSITGIPTHLRGNSYEPLDRVYYPSSNERTGRQQP